MGILIRIYIKFVYKVIRYLFILLSALIFVPLVLIVRLIHPFVLIRFGGFCYSRIGHFAADAGRYHADILLGKSNCLDLFWLPDHTCNDQWALMVRRNMNVYWWVRYMDKWNRLIPGGKKHIREGTRDTEGFIEQSRNTFSFLNSEDEYAKRWLRQKGWRDGEPFVCLLVRDEAFLPNYELTGLGDKKSYDQYNYHDYRNTEIDTYIPALEWLAKQGVWVFRMGKIMKKRLPKISPKIYDYAFSDQKNDLLDIWLFANCDLCISTGSGPDTISYVYRRPILHVNFMPLNLLWSWTNIVCSPKHLYWKVTGNHLTLNEYLLSNYLQSQAYKEHDIEIVDLTPDEILLATQEAWSRLKNEWEETAQDFNDNELFWEIFRNDPAFFTYHNWVNPLARISSVFLRSNQGWLK